MSGESGEQKRRGGKRTRAYRVASDRLKALRTARGWSQDEAAERAGLSDRSIRNAEAGEPLDLTTIALLAQLYSTPDVPLSSHDLMAALATARGATDAERHEVLIHRWFDEVWQAGRPGAIEELVSRNCRWHTAAGVLRGPTRIRAHFDAIRAAWGDFDLRLQQVVVQGDWAAVRWRKTAARRRRARAAASALRQRAVHGSTWLRIADGRVAEAWEYWPSPSSATSP